MPTNSQSRVWFITGASTGFGRILAEEVLRAGERVVATARRPEQIADLESAFPGAAKAVALDVTDPAAVEAATASALESFGRVDVLVNNAGYGLAGAVEEATEEEFMPVFETNVFGLIRVTRALLPQFRKQRSGHIVNLSSIGGLIGSPGWAYYNATKFAVEGFSEGLAAELAPLGVNVTAVEPGPFRTDFLGRSGVEANNRISDYDSTAGKTREYFHTQAGKQKGDPVRAVRAIITAVNSPQPPKHLVLGQLALTRFRKHMEDWRSELDRWEQTSLGADFPDEESGAEKLAGTTPAGQS